MKKILKNKKAIFFTIDALIALILILFAVLVIYPAIKPRLYESELSGDIIKVLSSLKIGEINNFYAINLRNDNRITDYNKTVLEQIGEFYVTNLTAAKELADSILLTVDPRENIGIWYGGTLLASRNLTSMEKASNIEVDRQIISGVQQGSSLTGFSAMAYLTSSSQKKYFYFGGYVGDGNISVNISYNGKLTGLDLEVAANTNFSFCINNGTNPLCPCGAATLVPSGSQFEPKEFPLFSGYGGCFNSGSNIIKFYGTQGKSLFFAGGFIKISYNESAVYEQANKYYFPGIDGIINIYDGFYVPGTLTDMEVFLHYKSNHTMFFNIGNATVFAENSSDLEVSRTLDNAFLSSRLDYNFMSNKTIPIRIGLANVSQMPVIIGGNADVILITDVSGSMDWRLNSQASGTTRNNCSDPLLYNNSTKRISLAKCLDKNFTAAILSVPGNRIGLVSFRGNAAIDHTLSNNSATLNFAINSYGANSGTCICCGINAAHNLLNSSSDPSRKKFILVMSDGGAGYRCTNIISCPPYNARCGDWPISVQRCFNGTSTVGTSCTSGNFVPWECNPPLTAAMNNTVWSANRTHSLLNANISSVGFFLGGCANAAYTLQEVARVGTGIYRLGNSAQELFQAYADIAAGINSISYVEQTANVTGNISAILYPDSYIKFSYTGASLPLAGAVLITTNENQFVDDYKGNFSVPSGSKILETKVISYSGPRWTQYVFINNTLVYNLSSYGSDYTGLGDPYAVNIPNLLVGEDNIINTIDLTTGVSPTNISAGSRFNKIIYTLVKGMPSYSNIASFADGCIWNIEFDTGSPITDLGVPGTSNDICYYNSTASQSKCAYYKIDGTTGECKDSDDAVKIAVHELLKSLDYDLDGKLDVNFVEQDLQIDFSDITGIPYPYSTEVQIRKWD